MRRNSSTIPFGYKLDVDDKTLLPIVKEIESLNEMKDGVKSGAFSLRGAVDILEHQTGRKLSAMGLKKIMDKDVPTKLKEQPKGLLARNDKETI